MLPVSDDMRAALTGPNPVIDFGADLLDDQDRVVEDISADVLALSVEYSLYANIHRTCSLKLTRDLVWGVDRVRPWLSLDGHAWPLGVFLLTSPQTEAGETPRIRSVSGMDKLWLLQRYVGDTYTISAGTSYLDAIRAVLAASGVTGSLLLDGDRQATVLAEPVVWLLTEEATTWLRIINDLLAMIGYRGLWVDEVGRFRSAPYRDPATVAPSWTFDASDVLSGIMGEDRSVSADVYGRINWWRFVRKMSTAPSEGAGLYTVNRSAGVLPRRRVAFLDVADQAALVAEGNRVVAQDTLTERVVSLSCSPLPLGHADVVWLADVDLGVSGAAQVRGWSVADDGTMSVDVEVL